MVYAFVLAIGVLAVVVYLVFALGEVPGMAAERIGELEPLPADLNRWRTEDGGEATAGGLLRQVRHVWVEAERQLYLQVRYLDPTTEEVVRLEPDQRVKRRRIRRRG